LLSLIAPTPAVGAFSVYGQW